MSSDDHAPSIGILANPAAGRDIRRLVAQASVFPIAEKRNMITRLFSSLGRLDIGTVYMMPDGNGIADRIRHALETPPPTGQTWPRIEFIDMPFEDRAVDTLVAVDKMAALGVGGIIVLGGDGTHRLVASRAGDIPITALSTGTNNVFPAMREATIAGLAAGLVATSGASQRPSEPSPQEAPRGAHKFPAPLGASLPLSISRSRTAGRARAR